MARARRKTSRRAGAAAIEAVRPRDGLGGDDDGVPYRAGLDDDLASIFTRESHHACGN